MIKIKEPIKVWHFYDAPKEWQDLSTNGGDEDWLALIPPGEIAPIWMDEGTRYGCSDVSEYELPDGYKVVIGSHA